MSRKTRMFGRGGMCVAVYDEFIYYDVGVKASESTFDHVMPRDGLCELASDSSSSTFFAPPSTSLPLTSPLVSPQSLPPTQRGSPTFAGCCHKCAPPRQPSFHRHQAHVVSDPSQVGPCLEPCLLDTHLTVYRPIRDHFRTLSTPFSLAPAVERRRSLSSRASHTCT